MAEVKKTITDALQDVDELVAEEIVGVVRDLIGIAHNSEDHRARVSAASKVLDYARPPKGSPLVNINMPGVVSNLGLPEGRSQAKRLKPKAPIELAPAPTQKILPEPNPLHATKFRGHFDATDPYQPPEPLLAKPAPLRSKSKVPGAPPRPPSPPGMLPMEHQDRDE